MKLLRLVLAIQFTALCLVLAVGVWANWQRDRDQDGQPDGFSLHVFDRSWWAMSRDQTRPLVQEAKQRAQQSWEDAQQPGGAVDQLQDTLERWFLAVPHQPSEPSTTSPAPASRPNASVGAPTPAPTPAVRAAEQVAAPGTVALPTTAAVPDVPPALVLAAINQAADYAARGLVLAKQPEQLSPEQLQQVRSDLQRADALLTEAIPLYEQMPGADPLVLSQAKAVHDRCATLLAVLPPQPEPTP